jgi:hypothetical protein
LTEFQDEEPKDEAEKREMVDYVPGLRLMYALVPAEKEQEFFDDTEKKIFPPFYPEFLYRKDTARRFLLDTNNLLIDILPGSGTALERFKMNHRVIDVFKAAEELKGLEHENKRREERILKGQLSDPDIERLTIVASDESLKGTGIIDTSTTPDNDDDDDNG